MRGDNKITCPSCRTKHNTRLEDIPKSRLILNFLEMSGAASRPVETPTQPSYNSQSHYSNPTQQYSEPSYDQYVSCSDYNAPEPQAQ